MRVEPPLQPPYVLGWGSFPRSPLGGIVAGQMVWGTGKPSPLPPLHPRIITNLSQKKVCSGESIRSRSPEREAQTI